MRYLHVSLHASIRRSTLIAVAAAATALGVCASPAPAHHDPAAPVAGAAPVVTAQGVSGVRAPVARHVDPKAEFASGATDETPAPGSVKLSAALPASCPVVDRTTDDARNSPYPPGARTIKVIYAHPADVGNRLSTYGPAIQAAVKAMSDFTASESGGRSQLRFDIGNFEGPHCVDIQRVALPGTSSYYGASAAQAFGKVAGDVLARLGPQASYRNVLIWADGVAPAGVAGEAEAAIGPAGESPSGAIHNGGGFFAVLYGRGGTDFFGSATPFPAGQTSRRHMEIALHEATHNLGAVQLSAPNSSGAGHCNDEYDVMCYEDGGSGSPFEAPECDGALSAPNDPYGPEFQAWDCNRDDYFNVSPAGGSYLDTHWNIADSAFLCAIATCTPPDAQSPDVMLTRVPRKRSRARRVKIKFVVSERATVRCRLDRRKPRPCNNVFKTRVKPGKHKIVVSATDQVGLRDPSPAKTRFRIKKRSKKGSKKG